MVQDEFFEELNDLDDFTINIFKNLIHLFEEIGATSGYTYNNKDALYNAHIYLPSPAGNGQEKISLMELKSNGMIRVRCIRIIDRLRKYGLNTELAFHMFDEVSELLGIEKGVHQTRQLPTLDNIPVKKIREKDAEFVKIMQNVAEKIIDLVAEKSRNRTHLTDGQETK